MPQYCEISLAMESKISESGLYQPTKSPSGIASNKEITNPVKDRNKLALK
ncbi:hypothetical protein GCM10020331_059320 [Ectobacillus funiculus]